MTTTVEQLIAREGIQYHAVSPTASVQRAAEVLVARSVGALLVMNEGVLVGIISERDCVRRVMAKQRNAHTTLVRDVMTPRPICAALSDTLDQCMSVMTRAHIRHMPVIDGAGVVGVITLGEAVQAVLAEREHLIEDLEGYIKGTPVSVRPPAH